MARLFTTGLEIGNILGEGMTTTGPATATIDSAVVRSGVRSRKVVASANYTLDGWTFTATVSRTYYARWAIQFSALPNAGDLLGFGCIRETVGNLGCEIIVAPSGVLSLAHQNTDAAIINGPTVQANVWYVVELSWKASTGACELRVDGVSYGTATGDITANTAWEYRIVSAINVGSVTIYHDDCALNDDQAGAGQTSWCGLGKVVMLRPTADSARTGFTTGAAGTTGLWDCVNNFPPVGVVQTSSTSTSQIKDATSSTTDNYVASLPAYTTAVASGGGGIGASDSVLLVQGVAVHGYNTTTSQSNGIKVTTNPAVSEVTGSSGTTLAATYPTGWTTLRTAYAYQPTVTRTTAVTMTFRKNTATTNYSMCCFIALLVEYVPLSRLSLMGVG